MRWPILTIAGITAAVLIGTVHAALARATDCLLGTDDLAPLNLDPFGHDGYGTP